MHQRQLQLQDQPVMDQTTTCYPMPHSFFFNNENPASLPSRNGENTSKKQARSNRRMILSQKRKRNGLPVYAREQYKEGQRRSQMHQRQMQLQDQPVMDQTTICYPMLPSFFFNNENSASLPSKNGENTCKKQARSNRRLILSQKRKHNGLPVYAREQYQEGHSRKRQCRRTEVAPSVTSSNLAKRRTQPWNFGPPTCTCKFCGAIMWYEERCKKAWNTKLPNFSLCCSEGKVKLPLLKKPPTALKDLLKYKGGTLATYYQNNMRTLNAMFSFTSMGGNIDYSLVNGRGPYNFRLNGHNYHRIGSLLPAEGQNARFAQLYIHDKENEVANRMGALNCEESSKETSSEIVDLLVKMLDENNVLVRSFRMARDRFRGSETRPLRLRLIANRYTDGRQYNLPTSSEVAALIVGDLNVENSHRDIIVEERSTGLKRIYSTHPSFMAMQYPLLFPYGEDGYRLGIKHNRVDGTLSQKETYVSHREYYAFRLQQRLDEGDTLLRGRRLFQQYVVDAYTCIEEARLMWVKNNQKKLRSDLYQGLKDAVYRGDTEPGSAGKRIYLPASFTGSPRYMVQNYQDAMAICRWAGYPDLFLTFTCNPKWKEIESFVALTPGEKAEDRPDIVARAFKIKLDQLLRDLVKEKLFGRVIAVVYTIEFQKRGLPHAHILLFLHPDDKNPGTSKIDEIISAEIPDYESDPEAYEAVKQFMMHGPCGEAKPTSPCMLDNKCSKHFPKNFTNETTIDDDGFAVYCRKDDGRFVEKNGIKLDNRYVVPYNAYLLVKFQAHINVEWCNRSRSIKYLFKYVTKGPDRATFILQQDNLEDGSVIDEVKEFLQCRFVSASEACWRILGFDIHYREPAVKRLTFHLEDQHHVTFEDDDYLDDVLDRPNVEKTMFTEWMKANETYEAAREMTYIDFPTKWVWHKDTQQWKPRKSGRCIGRVYNAHPTSGEKFYLRMLLNTVKGPRSYKEIKTVNSVEYPTYRGACYALGLLDDDKEWDDALSEASIWASGKQLRELFATILMYCEVSDPYALWERNWRLLSEDIVPRQRRILQHPTLQLSDQQLQGYTLYEIEEVLMQNGRSLKEFEPMPFPDMLLLRNSNNKLIQEELQHDREALGMEHIKLFNGLNLDQKKVYDAVVNAVTENKGGLFFVYGHGGTGKTYLWRTLLARFRSEGKIVLAVASSGIAALLMDGGRTAHSRFSIPINLSDESTCNIKQGTHLANLMIQASLIIWDEAPMAHRFCLESLDRSLRDILHFIDPGNQHKPFGGKTVVLGGDFRQILPVIPKGRREDIVNATINQSTLWEYCNIFKLSKNMRLQQPEGQKSSAQFADWILDIGDGRFSDENGQSWIDVPTDLVVPVLENPMEALVRDIYPDLCTRYVDASYLEERAILAPTNDIVQSINDYVTEQIDSLEETYLSADSICKASCNIEGQELLYPLEFLNSLTSPGFPNHKLRLKIGLPVMLLRNLNQNAGLCNGTRMVITQLAKWVVEAKIITGTHIGKKVFIPRIVLSPSESKWPFVMKRRQFPLSVCFSMTINKSQGQSLKRVGLFLTKSVFCHGQLYVAASRVTSREGLRIVASDSENEKTARVKNIVYKEVFYNLP